MDGARICDFNCLDAGLLGEDVEADDDDDDDDRNRCSAFLNLSLYGNRLPFGSLVGVRDDEALFEAGDRSEGE